MAPEGFVPQATSSQMVVRDSQPAGGRPVAIRVMGMLWCLIGCCFVPLVPVLANLLVAFGAVAAIAGGGKREHVMCLLCAQLAGCALTVALLGVEGLPLTIISIACAYVLAAGMATGRLTAEWGIVTATVATCAMLAADVASASLQGTTVTALMETVVNATVEANLTGLDLAATTALLETRDSLVAYWPSIYFGVGLAIVVCSWAGARLGSRVAGVAREPGTILRYDVPLWVALAFAAGVVAELAGPYLPAGQDAVAQVGANVVMCARIVLAQQGISVLVWWLHARRVAPPIRTLAVLSAVWLEMSCALTSVLGLVDVAVNFRHLERKRTDLVLRPTGER